MILGDVGNQSFVNPLLLKMDLKFSEIPLAQQSKDFSADFILAEFSPEAGRIDSSLLSIKKSLSLPGALAVEPISSTSTYHTVPVVVAHATTGAAASQTVGMALTSK